MSRRGGDGASRRRIGINALYWRPDAMGGTQTYLLRLVAAMRRVAPQHDYVLFLNEEGASAHAPELEGLEVDVCPLSGRRRPLRLLWEHTRLPSRANIRRVELLHSLGYIGPSGLAMPTVVTVLDLIHYHFPKQIGLSKRALWRWLFPRSLGSADHIIAISRNVAVEVQERFPMTRGRVTPVPLGVDPVPERVSDASVYLPDTPYLLAVASPAPHKNLDTLLRAMRDLATSHPTLSLKLVGMRTETTGRLMTVACELGVAQQVEFVGRVDDARLDALYRGAAAMVFPSLYEGFGLPPLEAMARGCPVIASDRSAVPEVVGDAATLVDAADPSALSRAIAALLSDPRERQRLRVAGLSRARALTWDATARGTLDVYDRVLASA